MHRHNWKRRYFMLKKDRLYYYANEGDNFPKVRAGKGGAKTRRRRWMKEG